MNHLGTATVAGSIPCDLSQKPGFLREPEQLFFWNHAIRQNLPLALLIIELLIQR